MSRSIGLTIAFLVTVAPRVVLASCGLQILAPQSATTVTEVRMVGDGAGGVWVTWSQNCGTDFDIYLQHVNANGSLQFSMSGIPVCSAPGDQRHPRLALDNAGGVVLCWEDGRTPSNGTDVYALRVTANGGIASGWPADGVGVYVGGGDQLLPEIVSDDSTGAVVAFNHYDWQGDKVKAVRVTGSGPLWTQFVFMGGDHFNSPVQTARDGAGGAILTFGNGAGTLYAQRIDRSGTLRWAQNGYPLPNPPVVTSASGVRPRICTDGAGGAFVAYHTYGAGTHVGVAHLSSGGIEQDVFGTTAAGQQSSAEIAAGTAGEVVVSWFDTRNCVSCTTRDIYAARVSLNGALCPAWAANGVRVTAAAADRLDMSLAPDGSNGGVTVWSEGNNHDIYERHLRPDAAVDTVQALCVSSNAKTGPTVVAAAQGSTLASWIDAAGGHPSGIFGQYSTVGPEQNPVAQGPFSSGGADDATQLSYALTLTPASNREVLVYVGTNGNAPRSVTFNSVPCSFVGQAINDQADPTYNLSGCYGYLYSLGNASLPGPGTYDVSIQFGYPTNAASVASMVANVDQATPFGPVSATADGPPVSSIGTVVMGCKPGLAIDMVIQDWLGSPGWVSTAPQQQRGHETYNQGRSAISISDRPVDGGVPVTMSGYASPMLGQALAQLAVVLLSASAGGEPNLAAVGSSNASGLVLDGVRPNPTRGANLTVSFTLPRQEPATLGLFDVSGRQWAKRDVGSLGPGAHRVELRPGRTLPAGIYLLRLNQGRAQAVRRAIVLD